MWIVEVNVLGRRFTYRARDHRGLRFSVRRVPARLAQRVHARATA
ncbi:hypothetical protein [Mycobacterium sp. URHB0044]|jgi:hypothetical protein|nr:hypothetical protein [Mycobacterium sp. URHB0044]